MSERDMVPATSESFAYKYARLSSDAAKGVRVAVLGSASANGYTTLAQADRMGELLELAPGKRLLDLGSGRGWPGARIAERTGCDLVVTDLPLLALRDAAGPEGGASSVVCADGRLLPFRDACFDAASHADVLCWLSDKLSVLRECGRVLKPGGLVAAVAIECPPGLDEDDRELAARLGPANVHAPGSLVDMAATAGLEPVLVEDWTDALRAVACRTITALEGAAAEIRAAEGDVVFDEEMGKKTRMVEGIDRGLLARTLVVARRVPRG